MPAIAAVPTRWYHNGMAVNVRIPEELDRKLGEMAKELHTSKHSLLLQGASFVVERHFRSAEISAAVDFVLDHDGELLKRLEDA